MKPFRVSADSITLPVVWKPGVRVGGKDIHRIIAACELALLWAGRTINSVKKFAAECHDAERDEDVFAVCERYCRLDD